MSEEAIPQPDPALALLTRRFERERAARKAAEALLSSKSSELFLAVQQASESQRQLELALWASGESIWEWQARTDSYFFRTFTDALNEPKVRELKFFEFLSQVHPDDVESTSMFWGMHLAGNSPTLDMLLRYQLDGVWRWFRIRGQTVGRRADGWAERIVGTVKDVTRFREAQAALRLMASAFASSRDAMVVMTEQWQIIECNHTFLTLTGSQAQALAGHSFSRFVDLPDSMLRQLRDYGYGRAEIVLDSSYERQLPVEISINRFAEEGDSDPYLIATLRDISERKRAASTVERLAREDAVTLLPNRHALQDVLSKRLADLESDRMLVVVFIDLDGFKGINDAMGHEAGDTLLQQVAGKLQAELSSQDLLARWGGDEFVAILEEGVAGARSNKIVQRFLHVLREPISISGHLTGISGSIGVAMAPEDGDDVGTLLRHADVAMYAAKRSGRDQACRYQPELESDGLQRMRMIALMRQVVERNGLTFVAQPKVGADGSLQGCELLMRWYSDEFGQVSPVRFIPLAEETGLILPMGRQAIREAAALLQACQQLQPDFSVAVNLSPLQLKDPELENVLLESCARYGLDPHQLQLEVTESAFLDNKQATSALLIGLKQRGFSLALDDFGTGYSALSYLRDLPFDVVKIDRAFLRDIEHDLRSRKLLAGIVDLCRALDMAIVAEGVESTSQLTVLETLGIKVYQGFLFYRPMSQAELREVLARQSGLSRLLPPVAG